MKNVIATFGGISLRSENGHEAPLGSADVKEIIGFRDTDDGTAECAAKEVMEPIEQEALETAA